MQNIDHIATGLAKIGMMLRADQWQRGEVGGLTPTQIQILQHLFRRGPARVTTLAAELAVSQPTTSDAAAALRKKKLVDTTPDPADARASLLQVTAAGRQAAQTFGQWPDAFLGAIDSLSGGERVVLLKSLMKMIRQLQVEGAIAPQRMCATCHYFRPHVHEDSAAPHHCDFVNAAFGDAALRIDCGDYETAPDSQARDAWRHFAGPAATKTDASSAATDEAS